jgi:cytochrome c biogenesis protein CcdA
MNALLLLCAPPIAAATTPRLVFSPPEWKFGSVLQGQAAQADVTVTSLETASLQVTFVPTCSCLTVTPGTARLSAGGSTTFHMVYDSSDDTGITTRGYIVRTDLRGAEPLYYLLRGVVRAEHAAPVAGTPPAAGGASAADGPPGAAASAGAWRAPGQAPAAALPIDYYYTPGCRSCEEFLATTLPRLAAARGLDVQVRRVDVLQAAGYQELVQLAQSRGEPLRSIPALRIGAVLLQGDAEIRAAMPGLLDAAKALPPAPPAPLETARESPGVPALRLAALPVAAAGLLDGINPCAFTTLIFLLASLALAGRGRGEVLLIGSLFSVAVFVSYFLIGLGFFTALRAAAAVPLISVVLRWVLVAVLAVFAGLSLYDYTLIRRGKPGEMVLQLPLALKQRIHASIRTRVRAVALAGSSLVLGFLVSVFEFACTGQVYLPTLAWLARTGDRARAIGLLLLYNLAFILPLLAVFAASYTGVSSSRIASSFQRHMGMVKIGLAVVFAGLAVVTLVA